MSGSKKITELTNLATSEDTDVIAIVDVSATETKKQTKGSFLAEVNEDLDAKAPIVHNHVAADITDFSTAADARITAQKGAVNGLATLGADQKIVSSQLPSLVITDTFVVNSQAAMLALSTAEQGDVAVRTDVTKSFILTDDDPSVLANWQELLSPSDAVLSVNGQTGIVSLDSDDISEGTNNLYFTSAREALYLKINGTRAMTGALAMGNNAITGASSVQTGIIKPAADSTTAFKITKADGTTYIMNVDTTNGRIGINTMAPTDLFTVNGDVRITGTLKLADGSLAANSLAHRGDENTGMYFPANDKMAFVTASVARLLIDDTGKIGIGITVPTQLLDVGLADGSNGIVANFLGGAAGTNIITINRTSGLSASAGIGLPSGRLGFTLGVYSVLGAYYDNPGAGNMPQILTGQDLGGNASAGTTGMLRATNAGTTGTDTVGGNLYLASGKGNGAGVGSTIYIQTPTKGTTGTTQQSYATRLAINEDGLTLYAAGSPLGKIYLDTVVLSDATAGEQTVSLPSAVGLTGKKYIIKKIDSSANLVVVEADGSETIDGDATKEIAFQNSAMVIISNGSNWFII